MVEAILAWSLLVVALLTGEAVWFIASGVFAIACNVNLMLNKMFGR